MASRLASFFPGLAVLRHYDPSWFRQDLLAGVSVAAVAVPIAIAYAQLAGVPPAHGLYASILPLVAYAFVGSSRQLIMAPDAATCAIVAATVMPLAAGDPARSISLTMALTLMTGVFCIVCGVMRLGFLTNFLARPILLGYLNGIALSIISGQLGRLFGLSLESGGFFRLLARFMSRLGQTHVPTLVVGLSIFVLLRVLKKVSPRVPAPLVAVAAAIVAAWTLDLGDRGVTLLGTIPAGLPALMIPALHESDSVPLALGAVGLALISFNSAMVTARGFAIKNRYEIDSNQEFIALGAADIGAALLQGFAVSGADSRTAVNDSAGGKTQVTSLVAAAVLVLVLMFLTVPLALLPIPALAAILINSALSLFDLESMVRLWRIHRQEFALALIALLGVISVGVLPGVVVAVGVALVQILARASYPHDAILGRVPGGHAFSNVADHPQAETYPGLVIYRFDSALLFFNADYFKSRVRAAVAEASPAPRHLVISAETMPAVDTTGMAVLGELVEELSGRGIAVRVAAAKGGVRLMFDRTGFGARIGADRLHPTVAAAVEALTGPGLPGPS
ncbi:MAG TPA: sulfate permease [Vicinamibacterales bacterium]|nr:sulfate permease [Vicinamibacterales bacterium]